MDRPACPPPPYAPAPAPAWKPGNGRERNWSWREWLALAILSAGLACTAYVHQLAQRYVDAQSRERFALASKDFFTTLEQSLKRQADQMLGLRVLYEALSDTPDAALHRSVRTRDILSQQPGLVALYHVKGQTKAELLGDLRVETLQGTGGQTTLAALHSKSGFQALKQALESGQTSVTPLMDMFPGTSKRWGFFLVTPVQASSPPDTSNANRQGIWLVAAVLLNDWLQAATQVLPAGMDVEVLGGTELLRPHLLFDADGHLTAEGGNGPPMARPLEQTKTFRLGEHPLVVRTSTTPVFENAVDRWTPLTAAALGTILSVLAAFSAWLTLSARYRAERRALELAADLELMSRVARYTGSMVAVTDTQHQITWVNEAFIRQTGFTPEDAYGKELAELLVVAAAAPETLPSIRRALTQRAALELETVFCGRQGKTRRVSMEMRPMADATGNFQGHINILADIEERRQDQDALEQALREQKGLRNILDQHAIVSETDPAGTITRVNDKFVQISGYAQAELVGKNHRVIGAGQHPSVFWEQMWRTIRSGRPWRGEICNRGKNGHLYWVDSLIAPLHDGSGQIERFLSIHTDITQHKQAQAALVSSQDMLTRTSRIAGIGGWFTDLQARRVYMSVECMQIFGLDPDWSKPIEPTLGYFVPQLQPQVLEVIESAVYAREAFDMVVTFTSAQGRSRWVRMLGEADAAEDGQPHRMVGAAQDITVQVLAQRRIEASERTLRSAIDAVDEAFALYDPQERLVFCNDKYREIYPRCRDVIMVGTRFEDIVRAGVERGEFPAAQTDPKAWTEQRLRNFRAPSSEEEVQTRDGRWFKVVSRTTQDGFHVGFRVDITDMKRALDAADAASRSKSQFLANMSHEIRTPLNAIQGMLKLLDYTGLTTRQSDLVDKAASASRSLLGILNDILDFSKVEAGKMRLAAEPFILDGLLRDLSNILAGTLGQKQLELIYDIDPRLPASFTADAMRLKQVLINLCGNAIKFTPSGSVTLRLHLDALANGVANVGFEVRDTGIGITAEQRERIFNGFTQAEASTARLYGGTGLGLVISQRIVRLMGGELRVDSRPGEGSSFSFQLPLPVHDAAHSIASPSGEMRALLADGHPDTRRALTVMLQALGWQVHAVATAGAAAEWMGERAQTGQRVDVLLIDPELPAADELFEKLPAERPTTVWLGTGLSARLARTPPGTCELTKPVTAHMVADAVNRLRAGNTHVALDRKVPSTRLAGLRLLLVEDNPINQEVAQEMLQREGAKVSVAPNGEIGVQQISAPGAQFDLVLMDMQMPVMDGLQATRLIRSQPAHANLPIVAMTANAMPGDRQSCLEAGMNDHVGKPFELDELVSAILRNLDRPSHLQEAVAPAASSSSQTCALDAEQAIRRLGGDSEFYARLLISFGATARHAANAAATDWKDLRRSSAAASIHKLKGSAAAVGATNLTEACTALERSLKNSDAAPPPEEPELFARLNKALDESLLAQEQWLAQHNARITPLASNNDQALRQGLLALREALETGDMRAFELHEQLQYQRPPASPLAWRTLDEAVERFDVGAALAALDALNKETVPATPPSSTGVEAKNPGTIDLSS